MEPSTITLPDDVIREEIRPRLTMRVAQRLNAITKASASQAQYYWIEKQFLKVFPSLTNELTYVKAALDALPAESGLSENNPARYTFGFWEVLYTHIVVPAVSDPVHYGNDSIELPTNLKNPANGIPCERRQDRMARVLRSYGDQALTNSILSPGYLYRIISDFHMRTLPTWIERHDFAFKLGSWMPDKYIHRLSLATAFENVQNWTEQRVLIQVLPRPSGEWPSAAKYGACTSHYSRVVVARTRSELLYTIAFRLAMTMKLDDFRLRWGFEMYNDPGKHEAAFVAIHRLEMRLRYAFLDDIESAVSNALANHGMLTREDAEDDDLTVALFPVVQDILAFFQEKHMNDLYDYVKLAELRLRGYIANAERSTALSGEDALEAFLRQDGWTFCHL
jgi:hypothetical protein